MKTRRALLLGAALLLSGCGQKKSAPATEPPAQEASPAKPVTTDAGTGTEAGTDAKTAAPPAGDPFAQDQATAAAWLRALGKHDAAALTALTALPFEMDLAMKEHAPCAKVGARATTAAELAALMRCLATDGPIPQGAAQLDGPVGVHSEAAEIEGDKDVPVTSALSGKVAWVRIAIEAVERSRTFVLGVADGKVHGVLLYNAIARE